MLHKVILEMVSVEMDIPVLCSFALPPWEPGLGNGLQRSSAFPRIAFLPLEGVLYLLSWCSPKKHILQSAAAFSRRLKPGLDNDSAKGTAAFSIDKAKIVLGKCCSSNPKSRFAS